MNETTPDDAPAARRRLFVLLVTITVVAVLVDQLTKTWAVAELTGRGRIDLLGDLFGLRLVRNPGAAFSIATGATWVFTILASTAVVVIARMSRKLGSRWWAVALGLLLGGALGNLMDRFFRQPGFARGHVVDFFELPNWPVFNIADSCIVVAAVLIAWLGLRGIGIDGRRDDEPEPGPSSQEGAQTGAEAATPAAGDPSGRDVADRGSA